jgi:hypothetical protein
MSDKVKIQKKIYGTTQVRYYTKSGGGDWAIGSDWTNLESQTPLYYGINATTSQCYRITRRVEREKHTPNGGGDPIIYVITTVLKYNKDGDVNETTKEYKYTSGQVITENEYNTSVSNSTTDTKMITEVFVNIANTKDSEVRSTDANYKITGLPPGYVMSGWPNTYTAGYTGYTNSDSNSLDTRPYDSETLIPNGVS